MKTNAAPHLRTNTIIYLMAIVNILTSFMFPVFKLISIWQKVCFPTFNAVYFKTQSHFTLHSTRSKQL